MEKNLTTEAERFLHTRHKDKRRVRFLRVLAVAVVFVTIYALILPAVTMSNEVECGMEEHVHTEDCWQEQLTPPQPQLTCSFQGTGAVVIHTHDSFCYDQQGELICTLEERTAHTHGAECYREHRELICTQVPDPGHTHAAACYAQDRGGELICGQEEGGPGHTHTRECYPLERMDEPQCGLEETEDVVDEATGEVTVPGHHHTTQCWEERVDRKLVCGQEESEDMVDPATGEVLVPGHHHSAGCWLSGDELCYQYGCGQHESQGHTHSDSCYAWTPRLICQEEERPAGHVHTDECYEITQLFVCLEAEVIPHTHEAGCYDENGVLVCQLPEVAVHQHTAECFTTPEGEPEPVRTLICGMEEHQHDERCYVRMEEDEGPTFYCGLEEHIHTMPGCYFESGALSCTIKEHVHDSSCLVPQEPEETDGPEETGSSIFPETPPEGYVEADVYSFGGAMFAMSGEEETGAAGLDARVYVPEDAFGEDAEVVFVPQPFVEEDAYDAAVAALDQAGVRYDSVTAMDLSFVSMEDGEVREPKLGPVYVRLTMQMELAEGEELALWHHTGGGVEKVYADIKGENGTLTVDFAANSFSTYLLTSEDGQTGDEAPKGPITWGPSTDPVVEHSEGEVWAWKVTNSAIRYLKIPVRINVSSQDIVTIQIPYELSDVGRKGSTAAPTCDLDSLQNKGNWEVSRDGETVTITSKTTDSHDTLDVYYKFDCWNMKNGEEFQVQVTVDGEPVTLKGKIETGYDVGFEAYANEWGDSNYAFSGFGGSDKKSAYILAWNSVYEEYFGLTKDAFNGSKAQYVYDIAPFEVQPTGQQPYDISGTITPDQGGEVLGGVYMMDSAKDPKALCVKIPESELQKDAENNKYSFAIKNDQLNGKVVSDLTEGADHKTYTLYFLVRYDRDKLIKEYNDKNEDTGNRTLKASLSLTHTGIDDKTPETAELETATLYEGNVNSTAKIYWASYVSNQVANRSGLTALNKGQSAMVDLSADFFCLNEARTTRNSEAPQEYTLEAIIDLSYLTGDNDNYILDGEFKRLESGDYRFSAFNLSLIDAPGSWSQNTSGTPNMGWTKDKFGANASHAWAGDIKIYGSESLTGDSWTQVATVSAAEVWARDQDRGFRNNDTLIPNGNYVRLKVVYDSTYTTALRVRYQVELKPDLVDKYQYLKEAEELHLTAWVNYMGYYHDPDGNKKADTSDCQFQRYPTDDSPGWDWSPEKGTIELARQYDKELSSVTGYNGGTGIWDLGYSLRVFAKATLGKSDDVAGMLVTQALYDSEGKIKGENVQDGSITNGQSFCQKTEVLNASEIVYSITGAVTNGSTSLGDLQERINKAEDGSPYKSTKMRYYVLLPDGLSLNTDPDMGEKDENGAPKYHFWTEGTTEYLSANSAFYNNNSSKVVQGGQTDVPVSDGQIVGWKRLSANGNLSEMYWVAGGSVTHDTGRSSGQLVVFERTLGNWCDYDRYNMWGTSETYFWGRGLSFSIVPTRGTATLPTGDYTVHFWCQYLDDNGDPIPLDGFVANSDKGPVEALGNVGDSDTLLYIPSTFHNISGSGGSKGELGVMDDNGKVSAQITVTPGDTAEGTQGQAYSYKLHYEVTDTSTNGTGNVALWCNVEDYAFNGVESEWRGTMTGVDIGNTGATVYVRTDTFDVNTYIKGAQQSWLTEGAHGWTEVPAAQLSTYDWRSVKAVAFSFGDKPFENTGDFVDVFIEMEAPMETDVSLVGDTAVSKVPGKNQYTTYNEFVFSDTHLGTQRGGALSKPTTVDLFIKTPVSYELPATGGPGVWYTLACVPLLAALCLWYKRKSAGEGAVDGP